MIPSLYANHTTKYESIFVTQVRGAINEVSYNAKISDYWEDRVNLTDKMWKSVDSTLQKNFARCTGF